MKLQKFFVIFFLLLATIQITLAYNLTIQNTQELVSGANLTGTANYLNYSYNETVTKGFNTSNTSNTTLIIPIHEWGGYYYEGSTIYYPNKAYIINTTGNPYTSEGTYYSDVTYKVRFYYDDGSTADWGVSTADDYWGIVPRTTRANRTVTNPYPNKPVTKVVTLTNLGSRSLTVYIDGFYAVGYEYYNPLTSNLNQSVYTIKTNKTGYYDKYTNITISPTNMTTNITGIYNAIINLYFINNYTGATINNVNYTIGDYPYNYNLTGTKNDSLTLPWINSTAQVNASVSIMYNSASQNITIPTGQSSHNISFTPIAIYIEFSAITNITVYHVDGINTTANNNSIYIYQDELPIGRTTISWNNDTQKIMYYNTRSDVFSAEMYVYPNLDSSMLDAPRRFKVLEDGVESNNARIFIEMQNGSTWKGFMGGLTGENGLTDIELIGGLTYRYTVFKEGYDSATGIFNTVAPPSGSEVETFIINIYSTSDGSENELTSGCLGTVKQDSICYYSLICGETTTCYYTITKRTYTNGTAYTETNYTGSTLGTVTGTWNTSNTTYKEIITATIDTDLTDETPATNTEQISLTIQTNTKNATYAPIKITDIQNPNNYKIWFIVLLLVGVIIGIFMETRVLTGSGIYGMAAIWGVSSVWLPSMMIPFVIVAAPKLAIEIWKRLN